MYPNETAKSDKVQQPGGFYNAAQSQAKPPVYGQPEPFKVVYNVSRPEEPSCCCGMKAKMALMVLYLLGCIGGAYSIQMFWEWTSYSFGKVIVGFNFAHLVVAVIAVSFLFAENGKGIFFTSLVGLLLVVIAGIYVLTDRHFQAEWHIPVIAIALRLIVCERSYKLYRHIQENHNFNKATGTNGLIA